MNKRQFFAIFMMLNMSSVGFAMEGYGIMPYECWERAYSRDKQAQRDLSSTVDRKEEKSEQLIASTNPESINWHSCLIAKVIACAKGMKKSLFLCIDRCRFSRFKDLETKKD